MKNRRRKQKESYLWNTIMVICAICTVLVAVFVVFTVFRQIKQDTSNWEIGEETTAAEIVIETEAVLGWVETEDGTRYREEDGTFATNSWKEWNGNLYYLNDSGIMEQSGSVSLDGQIFTFSDSGVLQDIQIDGSYTGMTQGEQETGKESLVRSNEFSVYLDTDSSYEGEFYPIMYKRSASEEEAYLGGEKVPEVTSENSLAILDGWIYYLPQISGSSAVLSSTEEGVCNKLFRMMPGDSTKELLSTDVTGYLVVDGTVYYASSGEIHKADTGTQYPVGENQFQIRIENEAAYLLDGMGNLVSGDSSGKKTVGDRKYTVDNGKILYVQAADRMANGVTYELKNVNGKNAITWKDASGQTGILAEAEYGINSFCIAENWIYYSAYVSRGQNGERFSQILRISLDGGERQTASEVFVGNILNLYYYEDERTIYGEYSPVSWQSAYGQIATVGLDGTVKKIDDSSVRDSGTNENMVLELLLANDGTLTCYENYCQWDQDTQTWKILDTRPVQFSDENQELVASSILLGENSSTEIEMPEASEPETLPEENSPETSTDPSETVGRPGEVIGEGIAPGMDQTAPPAESQSRPSETIGSQPETDSVIIIPAL